MQIITAALKMKLNQIESVKRCRHMQKEVTSTIKMASAICTQRSKAELVRHIKLTLPEFFGFEDCGIILRDQKEDTIYSINELRGEELVNWKKQQEDVSEHDLTILLDQFRETRTITYPSNQGITSQVLKTNEIFICNNLCEERAFQSDIDNQTGVKDVTSFMIGPVFGHQTDTLTSA